MTSSLFLTASGRFRTCRSLRGWAPMLPLTRPILMSTNSTSTNGVTAPQSATGFKAIQVSDFFEIASLLHPITVGTITIILLFLYLRLSSNRCVAPVTLFDWILNVALGSTLTGIVNGTSLVRGLISLVTLLLFQLISSQLSSNYRNVLERASNAPPLVIAFRGRALDKVMHHHRVSKSDLNASMRKFGIWNISQVEAVIIEPTGDFSVYKQDDCPDGVESEVLMAVPGYPRLVEHFDGSEKGPGKGTRAGLIGRHEQGTAGDLAMLRYQAGL